MPLLRDTQYNQLFLSGPLLHFCIQDRHGLTTIPLPGGKVDQQDLPAVKLRQRYRRMIRDAGQGEIGVELAHLRRITGGVRRDGEKRNASLGQHQQAPISNHPLHIHAGIYHYKFARLNTRISFRPEGPP